MDSLVYTKVYHKQKPRRLGVRGYCGGMVSIWTEVRSESHTAYRGSCATSARLRKRCGLAMEARVSGSLARGAFIFPNARKRNGAQKKRLHPHRQNQRCRP